MNLDRILLLVLTVTALAPTAWSQSFNIDIGPLDTEPPASYAAAGLAGVWNGVRADPIAINNIWATPQDVLLVDIYGNQTSVGFHQFGGFELVSASDPNVTGSDALLMNDYLATPSLTLGSCMYLNGLANGTYEVLVYARMPNSPSARQRVRFDYSTADTVVGGTWTGTHAEGVTYSRTLLEVSYGHIGFHVEIPSGGSIPPGAAFNGMQVRKIQTGAQVPALSGSGLGMLVASLAALAARYGSRTGASGTMSAASTLPAGSSRSIGTAAAP